MGLVPSSNLSRSVAPPASDSVREFDDDTAMNVLVVSVLLSGTRGALSAIKMDSSELLFASLGSSVLSGSILSLQAGLDSSTAWAGVLLVAANVVLPLAISFGSE